MKNIIESQQTSIIKIIKIFDQQFTYTPQGFIDGVHQAGIPNTVANQWSWTARDYIASIDKLLLAGGQDDYFFRHLYGEEPHPKLGPTSIDEILLKWH